MAKISEWIGFLNKMKEEFGDVEVILDRPIPDPNLSSDNKQLWYQWTKYLSVNDIDISVNADMGSLRYPISLHLG